MATTVIPYNNTPYDPSDESLLNSSIVSATFNPSINYIESTVSTPNQSFSFTEQQFSNYSFPDSGVTSNNISNIILDPESDVKNNGIDEGEYIIKYNFLKNELNSSFSNQIFFIKEISPDRTEVTLGYTSDPVETLSSVIGFRNQLNSNTNFFQDFFLNFGNDVLCVANNIAINNNTLDVLINLYEPLPSNINLKSTLWVVTQIANPLQFSVTITPEVTPFSITSYPLQGPNLNIPILDQINNSTGFETYNTLLTSSLLSTSYSQLNNLISSSGIEINIDYTDFSNFVHFSSAVTRINNFYYKKQLIDKYQQEINILNNITSLTTTGNTTLLTNQINNIIENFDGYEYFLYYGTGSWSYPKSGSTVPYTLYPAGSPEVLTWLGDAENLTGILGSASLYDRDNLDYLYNTVPNFIQEDNQNLPYQTFIDMVAQHYDNIWVYYKDVTNRYNTDNRLDYGISKDLVAEALKSFGVKLYQNNFSTNDLYSAFLGYGNPNPSTTNTLPVAADSGQEYIDNYITASYDASVMPLDDVNKEVYKRLYHNLPYLAKTKGTIPGLRALINCFGIPDTILRISEFGGRDKDISTYDYFDQKYNYAYYRSGSYLNNHIITPFRLNSDWNAINNAPESIQFRFKPSDTFPPTEDYQVLLKIGGNLMPPSGSIITLEYNGSGYASASYSGSTYSSSFQYGTLTYYPSIDLDSASEIYTNTASLYLPFFNGEWWSVMLNRSGSTYTLFAGSKGYYDGYDGNQILYLNSASVDEPIDNTPFSGSLSTFISFPTNEASRIININQQHFRFEGYLQELRYWSKTGSAEAFKDFIMNPSSIDTSEEENNYADYLAFRAPLGNELNIPIVGNSVNTSVHPKVTGSWETTSSFSSNSNYSYLTSSGVPYSFLPNIESFFYDQPIVGIKNRVTDKIQIISGSYPTGSVLSQYRSLEQTYPSLGSETPDINLLEVAFSPQNEINNDIISSLGYFNIGEYIGDPRQASSPNYPDLEILSNNFFQKYFASYNLFDYIRLIKYFDNSLFKMIKDFVPARTSLASGVVIKQHLLERSKYPQPLVEWEDVTYSGSIKSQQVWSDSKLLLTQSLIETSLIETFSGYTGGVFDLYPPETFGPISSFPLLETTDYINLLYYDDIITNISFPPPTYHTALPSPPPTNLLELSSSFIQPLPNPYDEFISYDQTQNKIITKYNGYIQLFAAGTSSLPDPSDPTTTRPAFTMAFVGPNLSASILSSNNEAYLPTNNPECRWLILYPTQPDYQQFYYTSSLVQCSIGDEYYFGVASSWLSTSGFEVSASFTIGINYLPATSIVYSWEENNIGPAGETIIIHSSQDEFYNGELPGTELIVENGELNEANIFKYPSTYEIEYNPTLYISNITNESDFTNPATSPDSGEIYLWWDSGSLTNPGNTRTVIPSKQLVTALGKLAADFYVNKTNGVKYIKVNRFDINGVNQSDYLGQLETITLIYPDRVNPIIYNIAGTQEFNDYYLYSIGPYAPGSMNNFNTSSAGEILDYSFLATSASAFGSLPDSEDADWGDIKFESFGTVIGNTLGYLTASNATYTFGNTPNKHLQVRFSGSYTYVASPGSSIVVGAGISNTGVFDNDSARIDLPLTVGTNNFDVSVILSNSINLIENNDLVFGMGRYLGDPTNVTINSLYVSMSLYDSSPFNGSSSLTLFNPYVPNYDYNDYNAVMNNAIENQISQFFMKVDYDQSPVIPSNLTIILDNNAPRAQVQDSNYDSRAYSNIRYNGSRTNSYRVITNQ